MGDPVGTPVDGFRIDDERVSRNTEVLAVHGDLDLRVAPELRARITRSIDGGAPSLVIDLSHVTFLDSMALGVLLGATKRLRALGGELRLVVPQTDVRRIFEITLLDHVLDIDRSRDSALAALAHAGTRA